MWLSVLAGSLLGTVLVSWSTWRRHQLSPAVVSMDRDMFSFNTTFPCVTVCPTAKIDLESLDAFVSSRNDQDKDKLREFIIALAHASYENFDTVPVYDDISPDDYMDLIVNLSLPFKSPLTVGATGVNLLIEPTITEMGLCYAVNSEVADYNAPLYRYENRWDMMETSVDTFYVHPLDGEVYAQITSMVSPYDIYIHGPQEVPDIASKKQHSEINHYMRIYVTAVAVFTAPETAKLSIEQRRCRLPHENTLRHSAVYTYTLCRAECRLALALARCGCVPHFYRRRDNEKTCDVKGLHCLANHKDELITLVTKEGRRTDCQCLPICDDVNYVIQSFVLQQWAYGTNVQWGVASCPRLRYRRAVIFGYTDVLVGVGSAAGLFLGCSVVSFAELHYYLSLRLYWYAQGRRKVS